MNILVLTAHPDDAEFLVGGTLARAAAQGHAVHILIATAGERGSLEYTAAELLRRRPSSLEPVLAFTDWRPVEAI